MLQHKHLKEPCYYCHINLCYVSQKLHRKITTSTVTIQGHHQYDPNDVGRSATLVKPVSLKKFKDILLDVDLSYSSADGCILKDEEGDNGFAMDSLLL
ncbi:hypothetical protein K7432_017002, partial [Basidiobolus ranarum]